MGQSSARMDTDALLPDFLGFNLNSILCFDYN